MCNLLVSFLALSLLPGALKPVALRCEYRTDPLGLDTLHPRFSWVLKADHRDELQKAYRILASHSLSALMQGRGDMWDSGEITSSQSQQVEYEGHPLNSGEKVWWRVMVWDKNGRPSAFSAPANWEMGLLHTADWKAKWISISGAPDAKQEQPAIYIRKSFSLQHPILHARLYASALGLYHLYLNGTKVDRAALTPDDSDYRKRVSYQDYDVTHLMHNGKNAVGMSLGDGWYCGHVGFGGAANYGSHPWGLAQIVITYRDGSKRIIATDGSWQAAYGPITSNDLLWGETYDARKRQAGWDTSNFQDSGWTPADANFTGAEPQLFAQYAPIARQVALLHPVSVKRQPNGVYIFDMGQNMVGWSRLRVEGPSGTRVQLRYGEMLNPDGSLYTANLRSAKATDVYILRGGGEEVYAPSFTFHGFRYVELSGYPGVPDLNTLRGVVVSTAVTPTDQFACSNPMVNQLQHNIWWGERGNYLSIPTDCPQRDERLGWMGDAEIFIRTGCYNADVARFMTKWTQDITDAQSAAGGFSDVSPRITDMADGAPGWGDAGVIVPWTIYLFYDDKRLLEERYDAMERWINYIHEANPDLLWRNRVNNNFGDWLNVNAPTPKDILSTAFFARDAFLMARMAHALGKTEDEKRYSDLFDRIRAAFQNAFVKPDGRMEGDTQTGYTLAIAFHLLPANLQSAAANYLTQDIMQKRDGHLDTGFLGTGYLLPALTRGGQDSVAYHLLLNNTYPSWGFEIANGATTIWERWDGYTPQKGFEDPGMNSFNHYAFGAVGQWMYETMAGLSPDPNHPGFRHFFLNPHPGGGMKYVRFTYTSLYGPIVSDWKIQNGRLFYHVVVPPNTSASLILPGMNPEGVTEGGNPAQKVEGVQFTGVKNGDTTWDLGSGSYDFETAMIHS